MALGFHILGECITIDDTFVMILQRHAFYCLISQSAFEVASMAMKKRSDNLQFLKSVSVSD